jgi:hypothetical protein
MGKKRGSSMHETTEQFENAAHAAQIKNYFFKINIFIFLDDMLILKIYFKNKKNIILMYL